MSIKRGSGAVGSDVSYLLLAFFLLAELQEYLITLDSNRSNPFPLILNPPTP